MPDPSAKQLQDILWRAADKLRGTMDAARFKEFVLGLVLKKLAIARLRLYLWPNLWCWWAGNAILCPKVRTLGTGGRPGPYGEGLWRGLGQLLVAGAISVLGSARRRRFGPVPFC